MSNNFVAQQLQLVTDELANIPEHTLVILSDVPEWQQVKGEDLKSYSAIAEKLLDSPVGAAVLMPVRALRIQAITIDKVSRSFKTAVSLPFWEGAYKSSKVGASENEKENANAKGIFSLTSAEVADSSWKRFAEMADYHNGISRSPEGIYCDSNDAIVLNKETGLYEAPSGRPSRSIKFCTGVIFLLVSRTSEKQGKYRDGYTVKKGKVKAALDGAVEVSYGTDRNTTMSVMTPQESAEVDAILASLGAPAPSVNVPAGVPAGLPA